MSYGFRSLKQFVCTFLSLYDLIVLRKPHGFETCVLMILNINDNLWILVHILFNLYIFDNIQYIISFFSLISSLSFYFLFSLCYYHYHIFFIYLFIFFSFCSFLCRGCQDGSRDPYRA